jgi:peptide/nickel transport system permease protein
MTVAKDIAVATPGLTADAFGRQERGRLSQLLRQWSVLIRRNPLGFAGLLIIILFAGIAILAPWIAPYGLNEFTAGQPNEAMSMQHWFGTDRIGRDVLSRDIYGARISLSVAFVSVLGGAAIGTAIGIISGYSGGMLDSMIQRSVDTLIAFPGLLLLLIIVQVLGPSFRRCARDHARHHPRRDARRARGCPVREEQPVRRSGALDRRIDAARAVSPHPS